ncbi:hypothetical protein ACHAXH_007895 [Discostella pseudostelligera]
MKIPRSSALAVLTGCSCSVEAFNYTPRPRRPYAARLPCSRQFTSLFARRPLHESSEGSSRRAVLQHCASIFATTAFAWIDGRDAANASEFSVGMDEPPHRPVLSAPSNDPNPMLSDEAVVLSIEPQNQRGEAPTISTQDEQLDVARESSPRDVQYDGSESIPADLQRNVAQETSQSSVVFAASTPSVTQVTLENSQVVTIPTKEVPVALFPATQSSKAASSPASPAIKVANTAPAPKQTTNGIALAVELSITTTVLGAVGKAVYGQMASNTDELTTRAKVILVENEPYGLAKGRRYFNGIDITRNEPIPASDVLEYCNAGTVNNDCAELITDFLGEVQSNSKRGLDGPSMRQKETATAVLSYLDTLSGSRDASSKTAAAFSSYLNGLSNGEIDAPASPQVVAGYLESLNESQSRVMPLESNSQGDMTRLIETFLISSDGYGEEANVNGKYETANGARMQLERVP